MPREAVAAMGFGELVEFLLESLVSLAQNIILLFALLFLYGSTNITSRPQTRLWQALLGLIIGGFSVLIMMTPWRIDEGLIFDARSVLLVVTGAFFGGITTAVAMVIALVYRIFAVGGDGVYAGILTIVLSSTIGLTWQHFRTRLPKMTRFFEYYLLGLIAHIATVLAQLAIPWPRAFDVIARIAPVFIGLFPFAVAVLSISLHNQSDRLNNALELKRKQLLLQAAIDSPRDMEIFAVDADYRYLSFNIFHKRSMRAYYTREPKIGENFLGFIVDDMMAYRLKTCLDKALLGQTFTTIDEVEDNSGKFLENFYAPIFDEDNKITGVTVFSHDVTDRKNYEQSILFLSYHDALTGLKNRRFYAEELLRLDNETDLPLSVIMADINGLKLMNDAFGHDAGDELLKTVASELSSCFSGWGSVARVGGDEFVMLLKNTTKEEALVVIDKCKAKIERHRLYGMDVSVSFGVETKTDGISIGEIIKIAEDDMYKHKLFESGSNRSEAIKAIMNTLHLKNPREQSHSLRVAELCQQIGRLMNLRKDEIELLGVVGNLHDIGKISISEHILNKPGPLSEEEWLEIRRHPEIGYRIISSSGEYQEIAEDILTHHERWDGRGYPHGLAGKDIPVRARIIAIADAFDAMTTERPYRTAMSEADALAEIRRCAGTQFDPVIAQKFIDFFS